MTIPPKNRRRASLWQGLFLAATGVWPILHLRSFEAVTGPKVDGWLVKATGGLLATIGAALVTGSRDRRPSEAMRVLGVGTALTLGGADVYYVAKGRISRVYLADAVVQAIFLTGWFKQAPRGLPAARQSP